jgi:hypothetical protein
MSSVLGVGTPLGWLCAQIIEAADLLTASRKISLGWTMEAFINIEVTRFYLNFKCLKNAYLSGF